MEKLASLPSFLGSVAETLSVVHGIGSYVVLKDIRGADDREVELIACWMVDALIDAAVREAPADGAPAETSRGRLPSA